MADSESGFDAFASYATDPDYRTVRAAERFLESLHSRAGIRARKLPPLRICVDGSDFALPKVDRAAPGDPIRGILESYLGISRRLLLFCSRGAARSERVDQELAYFLEHHPAEDVFSVVTEGIDPATNPGEIFSSRMIAAGLHTVPWYDLRGLRGRAAKQWRKVRDAEDEMVRLGAHLWNATPGTIYPSWQRAKIRRRRLTATAAVAMSIAAITGTAWLFYTNSDRYALQQLADRRSAARNAADRINANFAADNLNPMQKNVESTELKLGDAKLKTNASEAQRHYLNALKSHDAFFADENGQALIVHSIAAGVERRAIAAFIGRFNAFNGIRIEEAAAKLAEDGRLDDALFVSRAVPDEGLQANALAATGRATHKQAAAYTILLEAEKLGSAQARTTAPQSFKASDLVKAYLAIDRPDDALRVAQAFPTNLGAVGDYYVAKGNLRRAAEVLHDVQATPDDPRESIAHTLIYADRFTEARQWIGAAIPTAWQKAKLLASAAEKAVEKGKLDEARLALEQTAAISPTSIGPYPATELAKAWAALREPEKGVPILRAQWRILPKDDPDDQRMIIRTFAEIGYADEAISLLPKMAWESLRDHARKDIVEALIAQHRLPQALAAAGAEDHLRQLAYQAMIMEAASRGDSATTVSLLPKADTSSRDIRALEATLALVEHDDIRGAAQTAAFISYDEYANRALRAIAVGWAKKNDAARAAAAIEKIRHAGARSCASANVAEELRKTNAPADIVHEFVTKAAAVAPREDDYMFRDALPCVTSSLLAIEETDVALQVARAVTSDDTRDSLLASIIEHFAKRREYKQARDLTAEIVDSRRQSASVDAILATAKH